MLMRVKKPRPGDDGRVGWLMLTHTHTHTHKHTHTHTKGERRIEPAIRLTDLTRIKCCASYWFQDTPASEHGSNGEPVVVKGRQPAPARSLCTRQNMSLWLSCAILVEAWPASIPGDLLHPPPSAQSCPGSL